MNDVSGDARSGPGTVVVTDCDHGTMAPEASVFDPAGVPWRLERCRSAADVAERARDAAVLINQYAPITAEVLDAVQGCRLVVRYGVGVDNVDVAAAAERGVWVANVPDYGTEEVADHALALALSLLRGLPALSASVRTGEWEYRVARPLRRLSTLRFGIVGCGAIGSVAGRRAAAFGMEVVGVDVIEGRPAPGGPIRAVGLDELAATSDVISLHLALTPDTAHLVDAAFLAGVKRTALLVNTARGGLVDGEALLAALDEQRLAGAALDVLETEPPDDVGRRLVAHERVVVTPHTAWYSEESFTTLKTEVAREALRVLAGGPPRSPVNTPAEVRA
jgi:D-3-phosphoglycerate dehydrogenase / 2-oxoglutarate reductase